MKKVILLVFCLVLFWGVVTTLSAQNCDLLYFCVRYDSDLGEVDQSDRFTTGNITVMVLLEKPIGLYEITIELDKLNPRKNTFEYYKDYEFDVGYDMDYIFFNDVNFADPGIYRVFLLDPKGNTIVSSLVEIVK
ncbi:MAG: hypothetical protein HQ534_01670 [Armatimonadetes bacterium]|nr:hypothetical protein [Armatimonadota bacterium]